MGRSAMLQSNLEKKEEDERFGFLAPFKPFHGDSTLNTVADALFVTAALMFSILMISALHPKANDIFYNTPNGLVPWWFILLTTLVEICTIGWMYLKSVTREGDTGWQSDCTRVTQDKYRKSGYLFFDTLFAFPLELVLMAWPGPCYWTMIRHWLRWFRVYTIRHSDNPFAPSRFVVTFIAFLGVILLVHHVAACIAWGTFEDHADTNGNGEPLSYLDSLYWAVSTTTSTGYGDIAPTKDGPRIVGMFIMISGGLIVAATTAFVTSLLTNKDALDEEHDKKRKMMHSMLEHYEIPWKLRQHVITLFPHVLQTHSEAQFKAMMESLPPGLSRQLTQYVQAKMLKQVSVFKSLPDVSKLLALVDCLQQRFVDPLETIVEEGEDSLEMYFLIYGTVQVVKKVNEFDEIILSTLYSGTIFGELGVLTAAKRAASIVAITACEVMVLSKEDLDEVLADDRELAEYFSAQMTTYGLDKIKKENSSANFRRGSAASIGDDEPHDGEDVSPDEKFGVRTLSVLSSTEAASGVPVSNPLGRDELSADELSSDDNQGHTTSGSLKEGRASCVRFAPTPSGQGRRSSSQQERASISSSSDIPPPVDGKMFHHRHSPSTENINHADTTTTPDYPSLNASGREGADNEVVRASGSNQGENGASHGPPPHDFGQRHSLVAEDL